MTMTIKPFTSLGRLVLRPAPIHGASRLPLRVQAGRGYSSADKPANGQNAQQEVGPNMQQQEHVSEEAAKMAKITGGEGPDLTQGTPVQNLIKDDPEAQKSAPKVVKDAIKTNQAPPKPQSRPFSTYARRNMAIDSMSSSGVPLPPSLLPTSESSTQSTPASFESYTPPEFELATEDTTEEAGHKFGLPALPIPSHMNKDYRYDPVVDQVTNLSMKHGKKARAQRLVSDVLQHLRTTSPPTYNPARPLMPGTPPAEHLPLNPALYLTLALDSLAPLVRVAKIKGAAGGGLALDMPQPLNVRPRRRMAYQWILQSALKKANGGTGRTDLARRIGNEIIAVVEGRSSLWDRRTTVHKLATVARSNLGARQIKRRR